MTRFQDRERRWGIRGDDDGRPAEDDPTGVDDPTAPDPGGWEDVEDAGLAEATLVSCPYCAAPVELLIDPGGGPVQDYVEDCEVCCQPWSVRLTIAPDGAVSVALGTQDEV